jgi:hypothetical protein
MIGEVREDAPGLGEELRARRSNLVREQPS